MDANLYETLRLALARWKIEGWLGRMDATASYTRKEGTK
jgi:hypothetical protein